MRTRLTIAALILAAASAHAQTPPTFIGTHRYSAATGDSTFIPVGAPSSDGASQTAVVYDNTNGQIGLGVASPIGVDPVPQPTFGDAITPADSGALSEISVAVLNPGNGNGLPITSFSMDLEFLADDGATDLGGFNIQFQISEPLLPGTYFLFSIADLEMFVDIDIPQELIFVRHTYVEVNGGTNQVGAVGLSPVQVGEGSVSFFADTPQLPDGFYALSDGSTMDFGYRLTLIPTTPCDGDTNDDGAVDSTDLNAVLADFGSEESSADLNDDGAIDSTDLNLVLANFGAC